MTGANCFHVQGDSEGNGTYCTKRDIDAAVYNLIGEVREVTSWDSK